ncbi:54S ribosomal protein L3 [Annulohypoxylon maeteangense]|uniref:54S ribosomal protein L3 n=1 Tax=Annulohypoxylon maeteangense TaxID=1927788 RepID=UPI002007ABC4|nr:54S ribosomal protein L3 [Annulohypoxylon maeteangense]KAI0888966.1 54S ribosomal protein L3 [Annulohypoxylon maeteangense]
MKRIRLDRLSSQLLSSTPARPASTSHSTRICRTARTSRLQTPLLCPGQRRWQSTTPDVYTDQIDYQGTEGNEGTSYPSEEGKIQPLPSPPPERALYSAKLAALHARLSLSSKIPLQILARTLIDPSADSHPHYNNANLAFLGAALLQYHTSEMLIMRYPRLPMTILFSAMKGYSGVPALNQVARAWGVEACAAPGEEVDPGVLQFSSDKPTVMMNKWGYVRAESKELLKYKWRRGVSSRVIYDDAFGELVQKDGKPAQEAQEQAQKEGDDKSEVSDARNSRDLVVNDPSQNAHANFVRAVVGAIYQYCGRETAKIFVQSHVLSRKLDLENLFYFKLPIRELARLCAREDFDDPVARLLSETGRLSRTPVFVVGIYSGRDKLGEGTGPSLDAARTAAAINSLKSWYLYSPGDVGVPSDTFDEDAVHWEPAYVDIGEIIS